MVLIGTDVSRGYVGEGLRSLRIEAKSRFRRDRGHLKSSPSEDPETRSASRNSPTRIEGVPRRKSVLRPQIVGGFRAAKIRVQLRKLGYDKKARRYTWHIVVENGLKPRPSPGANVVSVDLGEIHPAVVGDKVAATIVTCRERRHLSQGHAKRLAKIQTAIARKAKGSRRRKRLVRAKVRMNAKHKQVMRDMEHKISRAIVDTAAERKAGTIVIGDVRDIADKGDKGKEHNGRMSRWNHGKIRAYVE